VPEREREEEGLLVLEEVGVPDGVADGVPAADTDDDGVPAAVPVADGIVEVEGVTPTEELAEVEGVTPTDAAGNPAGQLYLRTRASPVDATNNPNPVAESYCNP
jgi:hypothetical protein